MSGDALPSWRSVLAVVAHPDDESFALGAVLSAFTGRGARVAVLCLTRGEASTLRGVDGDLAAVRAAEFAAAARELAITDVMMCDYPDGGLPDVDAGTLRLEVSRAAAAVAGDGFVVFDPSGVTGHADHQRATAVTVAVAAQRRAVACHPSQAVPGSALWRRLELLGDHESLRWLSRPDGPTPPTESGRSPGDTGGMRS